MKKYKFRQPDSNFHLGAYVQIILGDRNRVGDGLQRLEHGKIVRIHHSENKICYDIEFTIWIDNDKKVRHCTRLHNIDSAFVTIQNTREDEKIKKVQFDDAGNIYEAPRDIPAPEHYEVSLIKQMDAICAPSLDPATHDKWEEVVVELCRNRKNLKNYGMEVHPPFGARMPFGGETRVSNTKGEIVD